MKRLAGPVAGLIACVLLASCGIGPDRVVDDFRPENNSAGGRESGQAPPPSRVDFSPQGPESLVKQYLQAAAAETKRDEVVKSYYEGSTTGPTQPEGRPNVVDIIGVSTPYSEPGGSESIDVTVQHLGELQEDGRIKPPSRSIETYKFGFIQRSGSLYLRSAPTDLLLSTDGLRNYFAQRPLYFWSSDKQALIQDLRYISTSLNPEQQNSRLVQWLYGQPAEYLSGSVRKPPPATKPRDNVSTAQDGATVVNLATTVQPEADLEQLAQQLAKTLQVSSLTGLRIISGGQVLRQKVTVNATLSDNVPPRRYAIVNGTVYRLKGTVPSGSKFLSNSDWNHNVVDVAVARNESAVALTRQEGTAYQLVVMSGSPPAAKVIRNIPAQVPAQPQWLDAGVTLLVQSGDELYQVDARNGDSQRVAQVPGLTQVSVAPDAHRLTLVIKGQLYLAARDDKGQIDFDNKTLVTARYPTVQSAAFHDVSKDKLIVAGTSADGGTYIAAVGVDGTGRAEYERKVTGPLRHLSVHAGQPPIYEVQGYCYEAGQYGAHRAVTSNDVEWMGDAPVSPFLIKAPSFEG